MQRSRRRSTSWRNSIRRRSTSGSRCTPDRSGLCSRAIGRGRSRPLFCRSPNRRLTPTRHARAQNSSSPSDIFSRSDRSQTRPAYHRARPDRPAERRRGAFHLAAYRCRCRRTFRSARRPLPRGGRGCRARARRVRDGSQRPAAADGRRAKSGCDSAARLVRLRSADRTAQRRHHHHQAPVGCVLRHGSRSLLRRRGVRTIVLCGIATNFGVESTARDAWERNYEIVFVEDAMSGLDADAHAFAIAKIFPRLGRIRSTEIVLSSLPK